MGRVGERLELHRLRRVHFFSEAKQVEGRVRADLVIHTCRKGAIEHRTKSQSENALTTQLFPSQHKLGDFFSIASRFG